VLYRKSVVIGINIAQPNMVAWE